MKCRSLLLPALALSFASGAALATDVSRDQVQAELAAWQMNPVTADGYRFVGGELGHVYEGPRAAQRRILGSGTGAEPLTREQIRRDREQFSNSPVTIDGYRHVGGEVGYVFEGRGAPQAMPGSAIGSGTAAGTLTREQVMREYEHFREHPVTAAGFRDMGGELGYVYEGIAR